ncbi:MAG: serine/threonine protein kinase [Planctomycetaceae bacterium]|nr:serine/threonine protein kinase [Planctomycetaceae bacterium]MCB9950395.1 serine/threonine protein kinase [Planctomycetaceae bacterium]
MTGSAPAPDAADDDGSAEPMLPPIDENAETTRDPMEMVASTFMEELRTGKRPSVDDFASRFPQQAEEIRDLLPMLIALEDVKAKHELDSVKQPLPQQLEIEQLGEYKILREIGRGGMGVVFEALYEKINRRVAVKLLPWRFPSRSRWRKQFLREAQLAARLKHPHIVTVYNYGEDNGRCYYAMQLVEGVGLDRLIQRLRQGRGIVAVDEIHKEFRQHGQGCDALMPTSGLSNRILKRGAWHQFGKIAAQIASAIRYAHRQGTLHRDIKPANIMLDTRGALWITDFGLAMAKEHALTGQEVVAGTLRYMSPEQFEGQFDERSDIYSFGVTLYELCTLVPAFSTSTRFQLVKGIKAGERRRPKEIVPTIPADFDEIIMRCMAVNPNERYQQISDVLEDLTRFLGGQPLRDAKETFWSRLWKPW